MKYLSVFSGMEAATVAWEPLGFEAVGFSEIEPFPCAILKHRFPNTPNYGDIRKHAEWPIQPGAIDLLVGGSPCQAFSVAGLRKGLEDPRGNLALTFLGLADKLRPKWIVWENVPGVLSSNGGRDFASFLGALGQLGYGWAYRVLDAQYFGVPQRRRRVFVVATTSPGGGRLAGEVLSLPEGLRGYLASRKQKRKGAAAYAGAGAEADGESVLWNGSDQPNAERLIDKAGTLNCNQGQRGGYICPAKPVVIDRAAFNQGENAQYEPHIEQTDVMDSLVARGPHAVGVPPICADKTGTLTVGHNSCAGHQHRMGDNSFLVADNAPVPYRKAKRAQSTTDDESWVEGEVSNTLNNFDLGDTRTTHAVVEPTPAPLMFKVRGGVEANDGSQGGEPGKTAGKGFLGSEDKAFTPAATQDQWLSQQMAVRRLTPVECERLQGFPDNWSRIPWKGKPEEDCPDGPRYKACGNSMAVPVMRWIGKRIQEVEGKAK